MLHSASADNPVFIKVGNRFVNLQDMLNKIDLCLQHCYSPGGPGYNIAKEKIDNLTNTQQF